MRKPRRPVPKNLAPLVDSLLGAAEKEAVAGPSAPSRGRLFSSLCALVGDLPEGFEPQDPLPDDALQRWHDGAAKELTDQEFTAALEAVGAYQEGAGAASKTWEEFLSNPSGAGAWRWERVWGSASAFKKDSGADPLPRAYRTVLRTWLRFGPGPDRYQKLRENLFKVRGFLQEARTPLEGYLGAVNFVCSFFRGEAVTEEGLELVRGMSRAAAQWGREAAGGGGLQGAALPRVFEGFVQRALNETLPGYEPPPWVWWAALAFEPGRSPREVIKAKTLAITGKMFNPPSAMAEAGEFFARAEGAALEAQNWQVLKEALRERQIEGDGGWPGGWDPFAVGPEKLGEYLEGLERIAPETYARHAPALRAMHAATPSVEPSVETKSGTAPESAGTKSESASVEQRWNTFLAKPTAEEAYLWANHWGKTAGGKAEAYEAILRSWERFRGTPEELRGLTASAHHVLEGAGDERSSYEGFLKLTCNLHQRERTPTEKDLLVRYLNSTARLSEKLNPRALVTPRELRDFHDRASKETAAEGGKPPGWVKIAAAAYAAAWETPVEHLKAAVSTQLKYLPGEAFPELLKAGRWVAEIAGGDAEAWDILEEALKARNYASPDKKMSLMWPEKKPDGSFDPREVEAYLKGLEAYAPEVYAARVNAGVLRKYGYDSELRTLTREVLSAGAGAAAAERAVARAIKLVEVMSLKGSAIALFGAAAVFPEGVPASVEGRMLKHLLTAAIAAPTQKARKDILEMARFGGSGPYETVARAVERVPASQAFELAGLCIDGSAKDPGDQKRNDHLTNFYLLGRDTLSKGVTSVLFAATRNPSQWAREIALTLQDPDRKVTGQEVVEAARLMVSAADYARWVWFEEAVKGGVPFQRLGFALERIGPGTPARLDPRRVQEAALELRSGMDPLRMEGVRKALAKVAESSDNGAEVAAALEAGLEGRSLEAGVNPPDMATKKATAAVKGTEELMTQMWEAKTPGEAPTKYPTVTEEEEEEMEEDDDEREEGHAWGGLEEVTGLAAEAARVASVMRAVTDGTIIPFSEAETISHNALAALCAAEDVSQFIGLRRWAREVVVRDLAEEANLGFTLIACYARGFLTLDELKKLETGFQGNSVSTTIRAYREQLRPEGEEAKTPTKQVTVRRARRVSALGRSVEDENELDSKILGIIEGARTPGVARDAVAEDSFLVAYIHNIPTVLARLIADEEVTRDEAVTLTNRARAASDRFEKIKGELEELLNTAPARVREELRELSRPARLTVDSIEEKVAGEYPGSSAQAGKKVTRNMRDKILTTAMQDAKDIALRSSVKQARKMAADLLTGFLSSRTTPRNAGETDESYAARVAENRRGLESFVASEAGQGIISYLLGMGWVVYEDEIADEKIRAVGGAVAREIRIQGGSGVVDDFFREVVAPMASFAQQSIMSLAATTPAADEAPKHRFETESGAAPDTRDKEIAELKEQLRKAKAGGGDPGDAPSPAAAPLTATATR